MSTVRPFAFEREFADREPANDAASEELAAAVAAAEARGFAAGEAAALERFREERETALNHTAASILEAFDAAEQRIAELTAGLERDAANIALAAAELLAGQAMAAEPAAAADATIGRLLGELRRGVPLQVRVHPDLLADLEQLLEARQQGERRQRSVTLLGDPQLRPGDARLTWDHGAAWVDLASRTAAVERAFAELAVSD